MRGDANVTAAMLMYNARFIIEDWSQYGEEGQGIFAWENGDECRRDSADDGFQKFSRAAGVLGILLVSASWILLLVLLVF